LAETATGCGQLAELISPIAEKYKGELRFATVDTTESASIVSKFFKVDGQRSPAIIVHGNQTFPIAEHITLTRDGISAWLKDFRSGKLTPQDSTVDAAEEIVDGRTALDGWKKGAAQKDEL
jgi:thioredoxin-like negative regulator of GroEL